MFSTDGATLLRTIEKAAESKSITASNSPSSVEFENKEK